MAGAESRVQWSKFSSAGASPGGSVVKDLPAMQRRWFYPTVLGKISHATEQLSARTAEPVF